MVWVPTSKTCTMCGGFFCRYAAMAAVSVSGYVPLRRGFTSYSFWLALNCFTSSFTASPSCPVMACQKWISVLAERGRRVCQAERGEQDSVQAAGSRASLSLAWVSLQFVQVTVRCA